jgi:GTP pyrophosphokinase
VFEPALDDFAAKLDAGQDWVLRAARLAADAGHLQVASVLIDLNLDADTLAAALLHYPLAEKALTKESIEAGFGADIARMAGEAARLRGVSAKSKTLQEAENIRKMLFAMVSDIRVIFIRLADRLERLRTLDPPDKAGAQECVDVYAPLADRLGISWMKDEFEDLSLKVLNRDTYNQIKDIVALKKGERQDFLRGIEAAITREAQALGLDIQVESRAKHFYSIYQKMRKRGKSAGEIFDLFGLRIIADSVEACYTLLGLVHRLWKPLDGRFKDYIARPKPNGYQSLHTTVQADEGASLEIQIRTTEMHRMAEYGVASHWLYKKGSTSEDVRSQDLPLVNRLRDWGPAASFLDEIKAGLLGGSIFVFTPQGKVLRLPEGATAIDFAYHVHSAVGDHCTGARADGAIIPLDAPLKSVQTIEILTMSNARPHVNWLNIAKTPKARSKIRAWLLENDPSATAFFEDNAKRVDKPSPTPPVPAAAPTTGGPVLNVVRGTGTSPGALREKNMLVRFAKCCNPLAGDPIVGYVSRGRGLIIHRQDCRSLASIPDLAQRCINTEWEDSAGNMVRRFRVEARQTSDLFAEIEGAIRKYQGHLIEGRLEERAGKHLTGFFTMQLEHQEDLPRVLKGIRGIPAVYSIQTQGAP